MMDKISKRFITFLAVSLALIPVTIYCFAHKDYLTAVIGIIAIILFVALSIYFQMRKLSNIELIEPEEIGTQLEEEEILATATTATTEQD